MATEIRWRRGTTAENDAFTGAQGEVTVDTTLNQLRLHDGATAGGFVFANIATLNAHKNDTGNPHSVTKTQVGLGNVTDDAQLKAASNLADLADKGAALSNLGLSHRNHIINGGFNIWQRGSSFNPGSSAYTADRWNSAAQTGGTGVATITREAFTLGQTGVPGEPTYYLRHDQDLATGAGHIFLQHRLEGVRTLAGRSAVLTFHAKAASSATYAARYQQYFGTGGIPSASVTGSANNLALTTSWQKFTVALTIPAISGKTIGTDGNDQLRLLFYSPDGATFTVDIAQVQLEAGSVATDFEHRPIGTELALCQRYFQKSYNLETPPGTVTDVGMVDLYLETANIKRIGTRLPVAMRSVPQVTTYSHVTGDSGKARAGASEVATTVQNSAEDSFNVENSGILANRFSFQFTADGEL